MKIELNRIDNAFYLEGVNDTDNKVYLDANPKAGGSNKGVRPMQLMLMAIAGCSSIDVISILSKQKQNIQSFKVVAEGQRDEKSVPSPFTSIHLKFIIKGEADLIKVNRAAELSISKYCSASASLNPDILVTWEIVLN